MNYNEMPREKLCYLLRRQLHNLVVLAEGFDPIVVTDVVNCAINKGYYECLLFAADIYEELKAYSEYENLYFQLAEKGSVIAQERLMNYYWNIDLGNDVNKAIHWRNAVIQSRNKLEGSKDGMVEIDRQYLDNLWDTEFWEKYEAEQ